MVNQEVRGEETILRKPGVWERVSEPAQRNCHRDLKKFFDSQDLNTAGKGQR